MFKGKNVLKDQAETLRKQAIVSSKQNRARTTTRVMSFTSGKGGVGKTHTVVNIGLALAAKGRSVLLLDADLGLANVDVMLGLRPKYTIQHVLNGKKRIEEIVIEAPGGVSVIPASSGVEDLVNLSSADKLILMNQIESLASRYEYLLVDTGAGISPDVLFFNSASSEVVVVISSEPTSLTDSYALIKILAQSYGERRILVLSNNVVSETKGQDTFKRLEKAVNRFLHIDLEYLGSVPGDPLVNLCIQEQLPLYLTHPSSIAARSLDSISSRVDSDFLRYRLKGGIQFFFNQLLEGELLNGH